MQRTRWIVVGTDFSDGAARALDQAVDLASELGARVALVHAFDDLPGTPMLHDPTPGITSELAVCSARSAAAKWGVRVDTFVRRGAPWDKLVNLATDLGADLIVVGARGQRAGNHDLFLGTVASRLATVSTRTVLVVPNPQTSSSR
jgi:nucleotide-binding universal stress UspA family protein